MAVVVARQMFLPYLFDLADVMPRGRWYSSIVWQMLLPICGRCFYTTVMDKEDYVQKARELLDQPTYRTINSDPTTKYKNKLGNLLKSIKAEGEIDETLYKKLYPTGAGSPKFYGLSNSIRKETL